MHSGREWLKERSRSTDPRSRGGWFERGNTRIATGERGKLFVELLVGLLVVSPEAIHFLRNASKRLSSPQALKRTRPQLRYGRRMQ